MRDVHVLNSLIREDPPQSFPALAEAAAAGWVTGPPYAATVPPGRRGRSEKDMMTLTLRVVFDAQRLRSQFKTSSAPWPQGSAHKNF